jgi:hypothetical protein
MVVLALGKVCKRLKVLARLFFVQFYFWTMFLIFWQIYIYLSGTHLLLF